ncbi:MAG: HAMP domain-containing histidine kinase, partial [Acidobacteria bacterium]|nr:HAMP domain-containing histidine kinase [Acidobacteriota bacterium]
NGNLLIEKQPVHLASIIGPVIDGVFPSAEAKKITLEVDVERSAKWINGDPNRIQQVVNNLLQNAIKFTPDGGKIAVSLGYDEDQALISVTDTGKGITSNFLPFVFDRYRQARGADRRAGLGLGLVIAKHIVELHGGTIRAESEGEGLGATFSIVLPVTAAIATAAEKPS